MDVLKYRIGVIICSFFFALQLCAQSGAPFRMRSVINTQSVPVDSYFQTDTTLSVFNGITCIYGLSVSMTVEAQAEDFLVRLILKDDNNEQYLVAETYRELSDRDTMIFTNYCEETSVLGGIVPTCLSLYVNNAQVHIDSIYVSITPNTIHHAPSLFQALRDSVNFLQKQIKVNNINSYIVTHDKLWRADVTELSLLPYNTKMQIIGCSDSLSTNGIEYYAEGIFELSDLSNIPVIQDSSLFVNEFDWNTRHGKGMDGQEGWMTSVKNQFSTPYCTAFAVTAGIEAMSRLYFNRIFDIELSKQELACCASINTDTVKIGINPSSALNYVKNNGVVLEDDYPFDKDGPQICHRDEFYASDSVRIADYNTHSNFSTEQIKNLLINNGPLVSWIKAEKYRGKDNKYHYRFNHSMLLVGYGVIENGFVVRKYFPNIPYSKDTINDHDERIGMTYWKFKNSWGSYGDNSGYMYLLLDTISVIHRLYSIQTPIQMKRYIDTDIICEDSDRDGFYTWGIGPKPTYLSDSIPETPDGDDSNPLLGPMNLYGFCEDINPVTRPVEYISIDQTTINDSNLYSHYEIIDNATWTISHKQTFFNGAKVTIRNGSTLIVTNEASLEDVEIIMEDGAKLKITDNGKVHLRDGVYFAPPQGAIVEIEYGEIK